MDPVRLLLLRFEPFLSGPSWPRLRAVLLAAHVLAVVLVALPAPIRKLDQAAWQRPTLRAELQNWTRRARSLGIDATEDQIRDFVTQVSAGWQEGRRGVVAPLLIYVDALGIPQNWYMFTGPDRVPQRFGLAFTAPRGLLQPVFDLNQSLERPEFVPRDFLLGHRVRRALFQTAWSRNPQTFDDVCAYFDRQLRLARPDIDDVVCRLEAQAVLHPARPDEARPVTTTRTLVVHSDQTRSDTIRKAKRPKKARAKP